MSTYMSQDEFTKLFTAIQSVQNQVNDMRQEMSTKEDINGIYDKLDNIAARLDDDMTERAALTAQVERHETWIDQLAQKTQTDLAVDA